MKQIIGICVLALLLTSCSAAQKQYAIQSSLIGVEASVLRDQYEKVELLLREKQDISKTFSDAEWRKLLNLDASIDMLIVKYDAMIALDTTSMNLQDVQYMWQLAAEGYTQARSVIQAHMEEFQPSTQVLLHAFDSQAEMTSERVGSLLSDPNNANINETLVLIAGVLSIAVKMLSLVAI